MVAEVARPARRGARRAGPFAHRPGLGVHDEERDAAEALEAAGLGQSRIAAGLDRLLDRRAQPQVVGERAVEQVDVGVTGRGAVLRDPQRLLVQPCVRISAPDLFAHPRGWLVPAAARGVVLERDRRQRERDRRGRRHRSRDRKARACRSTKVELLLIEREARRERHVRGVDQERRSVALEQVAERRAVEELFVVVLGGQIAAAEIGRGESQPVPRRQQAPDQCALDVAAQELALRNPRRSARRTARSRRP